MESNFLKQIGFGNFDLGYLLIGMIVVSVILLLMIIILIIQMNKVKKLKRRLDHFLLGKEGVSLEDDIISIIEDKKFLKNSTEKNRKDISILFKRLETTFQKVGIVKYDAFSQMGGQLSFCIALLDENDNGFIINSVHSTEGCYTYTKEIKNGECKITLGTEEAEAMAIAMGK